MVTRMEHALIEVDHLTKRYGATMAVDDASLAVRPGCVTGFLGPNGAGKSTTMRMIVGLDTPTAGTIRVGGRRYRDIAEPLRAVGALLDATAVDGGRSADNHLRWLAESNGIDRRRIDGLLELVGLGDVAAKPVGTFSLGMKQRLGVAAALIGDPKILVFDEPINGLDPDGVAWIRSLMKALASEGRTVLLSSHLMSEMAQTADHLLVIGRGRILADASAADLIHRHATSRVRVRAVEQNELAHALTRRGGRVAGCGDGALLVAGLEPQTIGATAGVNAVTLIELTPQVTCLEEAFFELTHDVTDYGANPAAAAKGA